MSCRISRFGNIFLICVIALVGEKVAHAYATGSILGNTDISPSAITIDSNGNIYTANTGANNVTKINPAGVATTLGTTSDTPQAITIDSNGNIYTANTGANNVTKITPAGVATTLGTTGSNPIAITIDSNGNIYTANYSSNNVTKITPAGVATTLGTTGSGPIAITIDSIGNIYTANESSDNVTKITPAGVATTLGTTGSGPRAITIDSNGNIYTANYSSNNVTKFAMSAPTVLAVPIVVSFDTQGGSPIAKGVTLNGGSIVDPGTPTREGYSFAGWNTAANGTGTAITFPYHHTNSSDFTLYAQWRAIVSTTPTTTPPTTVVMPLIPEELPSTGSEFAPWPLLFIAAGFALIALRRYATTR